MFPVLQLTYRSGGAGSIPVRGTFLAILQSFAKISLIVLLSV